MRMRTACLFIATVSALVSTTGCMPKMSVDDLGAMQPPRPKQLDRLDMLLGRWETTGEIRMAMLDEPVKTGGTNDATWALGKRMLIEHADLDMGPMGHMTGMSVWTWDEARGKYRMWWFDSMGEFSEATVTYNERTKTWSMRGKGSKHGFITFGRGTLRQIDDDTLEWTWREYDPLGLFKFADMKGISRRRE